MKKITLFALLLTSLQAFCQSSWLDPVTINGPVEVCDQTPYKLVFYDGFEGNTLDTTKWITWYSWNGMRYPKAPGDTVLQDCENCSGWTAARYDPDGAPYTNRKENVVVSGGTVKLKIRHEPNEWHCSSCPPNDSVYYTGAWLSTYFWRDGGRKSFATGKFEFKARFPVTNHTYGTVWTWYGIRRGVNEIDIAETGGAQPPKHPNPHPMWVYNWRDYVPYAINPTHAWGIDGDDFEPFPIPYHTVRNVTQTVTPRYPHQRWIDYLFHHQFRQQDWHTYTCEWDSTLIVSYVDNDVFQKFYKYYRDYMYYSPVYQKFYPIHITNTCNVDGIYKISRGFPYRLNSESQLRIITGIQKTMPVEASAAIYDIDQTELDYVKIWQRHPEQDGYTEICTQQPSVINGPASVCGSTTYSIQPAMSGGTWSCDNGAVIFTGGISGNTTIIAQPNPNTTAHNAIISYTYTPNGCPPVTISKAVSIGTVGTNVVCFRNWYLFKENFSLGVSPYIPNTTYHWEVWYGLSSGNTSYYQATGPNVHTPRFLHYLIPFYYIKWKLTITNSCGSRVIEGTKNNSVLYTALLMARPESYREADSSVYYLETRLTEQDSIAYERAVEEIVASRQFTDTTDTKAIEDAIDEARFDALQPYIYFEDAEAQMLYNYTLPFMSNTPDMRKVEVYPNPSQKQISVILGTSFDPKMSIHYQITNLMGVVLKEGVLPEKPDIDIENISAGTYVIQLQQAAIRSYAKFTKR